MSDAAKRLQEIARSRQPIPDLYMTDENGNELPGVVVEYLGRPIRIPERAVEDDALRKRMLGHFRTTRDFASYYSLDTETGSPAGIRALVGSAPEQDKLANPSRLFPGNPYRVPR